MTNKVKYLLKNCALASLALFGLISTFINLNMDFTIGEVNI